MATLHDFGDGRIAVTVSTTGAELMSLRDPAGREWLWQGDPASWPRRAPMLFPVIGRCADNVLRHGGRKYPMEQGHGYAPLRDFRTVAASPTGCTLRLEPDDETRRSFPFDMRLDVTFTAQDGTLTQTAIVTNIGAETGVASVGFHPGFQWPMPDSLDLPQTAYVVRFERDEPAPFRRITAGRLSAESYPTEIVRRTLALRPELFAADAMVFDRIQSRSVWFGAPGRPGVRADFPDCPYLGLWMRPGARYLCIEPWQGHHCPEGFSGDIMDKPGMVRLAPGESFSRTMAMTIGAPDPV